MILGLENEGDEKIKKWQFGDQQEKM